MGRLRFPVALVTLGLLLAPPTPASAQSLTLTGDGGVGRQLTLADLAALPAEEIAVTGSDGVVATYRGPSLRSLATTAGAPTGRMLRGPNMLLAILAEAADGYRVGYMLAEIDEQFGARRAIVALTENGRPLAAQDGPLRIIVEGEQHRARWIRQVTSIRLVRLAP